MRVIIGIAIGLGALALLPGSALAQDAAETAVITTATGPSTGRAQRSLGNAVSGSLNGAAGILRSTARRGGRPARGSVRRGAVRVSRQGLPAGVDPLEGTDASAYKLDNGVTIKISGRMAPSAQARCVKDCEAAAAQSGSVSVEKRPSDNAATSTAVKISD
ncbi:MAG: hypothetical protein ABJ239_03900 [Erythrobacter sp.]